MSQGWIKLHRSLLDDELWNDCNERQKVVMITLLLMANHEERSWIFEGEKYIVQPGEMITSLKSISRKSGVDISTVRRSLDKFEKYGFSTSKSTNKNRLISIVNWTKYQDRDEEPTSKPTSNRQATDKQPTTNKNDKNDKNDKEDIYSREIIDYLNKKASKGFKASTRKNQELIKARINEGFNVEDFKKVIDNKVLSWKGDSKMDQYLRPVTLFGTKFESYLNENVAVGAKSKEEEIAEKYKDLDDIWTY